MLLQNLQKAPRANNRSSLAKDETSGPFVATCSSVRKNDDNHLKMYLATIPLIESLPEVIQQIWFADDARGGGKLKDLKKWWESLLENGPKLATIQTH